MIWIPPFALEISVVCLGIFLLMMDCFSKIDKISIGWAAIAGLLASWGFHFLPVRCQRAHSSGLLSGRSAGPLL